MGKKRWCYIIMCVCVVLAAACSDDEETGEALSALVAGDYSGTITMTFAYGALEYADETITLTAAGSERVLFSFSDEALGRVSLVVALHSGSGDTVVLEDTAGTFAMPQHSGEWAEYQCIVGGTVDTAGSDYCFTITLPAVMGGTTLTLVP